MRKHLSRLCCNERRFCFTKSTWCSSNKAGLSKSWKPCMRKVEPPTLGRRMHLKAVIHLHHQVEEVHIIQDRRREGDTFEIQCCCCFYQGHAAGSACLDFLGRLSVSL